jgi:peptide/nickel transport system substrate-binding protein
VVLALGTLLLIPGVGGAQTVRLIAEADLKDVDPVFNLVSIVSNHGYMVYDTLFAMDSNLKPQPQMVV